MRDMSISPHNASWVTLFEEEAEALSNVLSDNLHAIHHMGSTSVPDLVAKPIIDILVEVKDITNLPRADLENLGYHWRGEAGMPFRRFLYKNDILKSGENIDQKRTHHLHIFERGNPQVERQLTFCHYLRSHNEARQTYGNLKQKLAQQFRFDRFAYTSGKDALIARMVDEAGFSGLTLFEAVLDSEWAGYHHIRAHQNPDYTPIIHTPSFLRKDAEHQGTDHKNQDHKHMVWKQGGSHILAAAEVAFDDSGKMKIIFIATHAEAEASVLEKFHSLLKRWESMRE